MKEVQKCKNEKPSYGNGANYESHYPRTQTRECTFARGVAVPVGPEEVVEKVELVEKTKFYCLSPRIPIFLNDVLLDAEVTHTLPVESPQSAPKMAGSMLKHPVGRDRGE